MPKQKNIRHFAEVFVSNTLLRHPEAKEESLDFIRDKSTFGHIWPDWCHLPMAATYAILTHHSDDPDPSQALALAGGAPELSSLTAALIWCSFKGVYRFDATLLEEMSTQQLEGKIPTQILFCLPEPCIFVEATVPFNGLKFDGFFAWMENDTGKHRSTGAELRFLFITKEGECLPFPIILAETIEDSLDELLESAARRSGIDIHKQESASFGQEISLALNLVLYLCSDEPDVGGEYKWAHRPSTTRKEPKKAAQWNVGVRIGNAIRRYNNQRLIPQTVREDESKSHASPRPHIRRAHWHHFWTGAMSGERVLKLRWLPPIPVGADIDSEMPVTIRLVKDCK